MSIVGINGDIRVGGFVECGDVDGDIRVGGVEWECQW